jgi:hypothetical protein
MKRKQEANDHISVYRVAILPVIIIVISLFFISLGGSSSHSSHFLQNAVAMNTNTTLANTTGKAGSETAESLVRSLMDPTSLMTSVINQTGGSTTNTTNSTESAQLKKPITADNISNAIGGALSTQSKIISTTTPPPPKNGNTTPIITTTSSSPSSLPPLPSATSQSNNATLIPPTQPTSAQAATTTNTTTTIPSTENNNNNNQQQNITQTTVVRNIATLLLAHQIVPPKDFIHIYDTTPYNILNGHLVAKIPCDANSAPSLQILIGHLPDLKPVQPQLIKEFSKPGYICMYNVDIGSPTMTTTTSYGSNTDKGDNIMNTDLVLRNPTDYRITLPSTSTVVIGVNEIVPLPTMDNPNHPEETKGQINNIINDMNTSTTMPK